MKIFCQLVLILNLALAASGQTSPNILRVGTSADYEPFSFAETATAEPQGFEIDLAKAFAADHGLTVEFIRFNWPDLSADLAADRFDVAMSGVTVRPDRSLGAIFSIPTTATGVVLIVPREQADHSPLDFNRSGIRIGVNHGGHLEKVTRSTFDQATTITSSDNQAVPDLLLTGKVDGVITDTTEAPHWLERLEGAVGLPAFTRDLKAWMIRPDRDQLARDMNLWLLAAEANGTLTALRSHHLSTDNRDQTATPLSALLAAIDERLSLMAMVAESKRALQRPVEDLAQEARVRQSAVDHVIAEATLQGKTAVDEDNVSAFFRAQIEAAKAIQFRVLAASPASGPPPDLSTELRPALARISAKLNLLIVVLANDASAPKSPTDLAAQVRVTLAKHELPDDLLSLVTSSIEQLIN
jgi:cyclohexadienyl dehydratase